MHFAEKVTKTPLKLITFCVLFDDFWRLRGAWNGPCTETGQEDTRKSSKIALDKTLGFLAYVLSKSR